MGQRFSYQKLVKLSNEEKLQETNPSPLLICPKCLINIPLITPIVNEGNIILKVKCQCDPNDEDPEEIPLIDYVQNLQSCPCLINAITQNLPSRSYLRSLIRFLTSFICSKSKSSSNANQFNIYCKNHSQTFTHYCHNCNMNLCTQCTNAHPYHHYLTRFTSFKSSIPHYSQIKTINKNIITIVNDFLSKETKHNGNNTLFYQQLQDDFARHTILNEALIAFTKIVVSTYNLLQYYPTYQLTKLYNSINVNTSLSFVQDKGDIQLEELQSFLGKDFLISYDSFSTKAFGMGYIYSIEQISPHRIACGSNKLITIWSIDSLEWETTLPIGDYAVVCLKNLPDNLLASGGDNGQLIFWNSYRGKALASFGDHKKSIIKLERLSNGLLASGCIDNTIRLWNCTTLQCTTKFRGDYWILLFIQLQSEDFMPMVWKPNTMKCVGKLEGRTEVKKIVLLGDSQLLGCVIEGSNEVSIINCRTFVELRKLGGHYYAVTDVMVIHGTKLMTYSDQEKKAYVWDIKTFEMITSIDMEAEGDVLHMIQLDDGRVIASQRGKGMRIMQSAALL